MIYAINTTLLPFTVLHASSLNGKSYEICKSSHCVICTYKCNLHFIGLSRDEKERGRDGKGERCHERDKRVRERERVRQIPRHSENENSLRRRGQWDSAAWTINLSDTPPTRQMWQALRCSAVCAAAASATVAAPASTSASFVTSGSN